MSRLFAANDLLPLINVFLFGVFAALYALYNGSLWGIAAWHAVWNWVQGSVFGFAVNGSGGLFTLFNLQETGPEGGLAVRAELFVSMAIIFVLAQRQPAPVDRSPAPAGHEV